MTPTPDQTPERPLDDCPFCGSKVKFYEVDPGAPFCGYYLGITHVHEDESFDDENPCPGNRLDNAIKVCTDQQWAFAENYATRKQAEDELADGWNRRITDALRFQRIAKLEEDRADLSKCVQWLIANTSEEARRLFPGTIARLQKIASAVLPPTPGATNATLVERVRSLEEALNAADSVMWMAERYAEGGGSNGPEMQDYLSATRIVLKVRGSYHNPSPTPGAAVGKEGE